MIFFGLLGGILGLLTIAPVARLRRLPLRERARIAMALAFIGAGITHFVTPKPFLQMMPAWQPLPLETVYLTGILEIAGGLGLLVPSLQRFAALALAAYLVAVFPANLNVAISGIQVEGYPSGSWYHWLRLPFQAVFIGGLLWSTAGVSTNRPRGSLIGARRGRMRGRRPAMVPIRQVRNNRACWAAVWTASRQSRAS